MVQVGDYVQCLGDCGDVECAQFAFGAEIGESASEKVGSHGRRLLLEILEDDSGCDLVSDDETIAPSVAGVKGLLRFAGGFSLCAFDEARGGRGN